MCINCNLVSPVQHQIADMLGIPRNKYGIVSNTFDVLQDLLVDMYMYEKYNSSSKKSVPYKPDMPKYAQTHKLYDYLVEHNLFHYLEDFTDKSEYHSVVNQQMINYVLVKFMTIDWQNDESIVDTFCVPVELLTTDVQRLKRCIGPTTFSQKELIPSDIIEKYKITSEPAIAYKICMLPEQEYFKVDI